MELYHASPVTGIKALMPHVSNHGISEVYFSQKRENVLIYLCNAVEKYCKETGYDYNGTWEKWGPYGFNQDGIIRLEEYYPNALSKTYQGVSGYIYRAEKEESMKLLSDIPGAYVSAAPVPTTSCEFIPDAYDEIMMAYHNNKIDILKFEDGSSQWHTWIEKQMRTEYQNAHDHPEYRHFLKGNFDRIKFE